MTAYDPISSPAPVASYWKEIRQVLTEKYPIDHNKSFVTETEKKSPLSLCGAQFSSIMPNFDSI